MATEPKYAWRKLRQKDTLGRVGRFFEALARGILGGKISPQSNGDGDLVRGDVMAGIEVKASDHNHTFRIPIDQVVYYRQISNGFPLDHYLFCLCCYKNSTSRKAGRKSPLNRCRQESDVNSFLAKNVDTLYVLDIQVLDAILARQGLVKGKLPCQPEREVIEIKRKLLRSFNSLNAENILSYLGLDPRIWRIKEKEVSRSFKIDLFKHKTSFKVIEILSPNFQRRIDRLARSKKPKARKPFMRLVPAPRSFVLKKQAAG